MALLTWSDMYSVKVTDFDNQHKKLIDLINQLHDAMKAGKGKEAAGQVLNALVEYTQKHFAAEEGLMKLHAYPEYESHKKEHNTLVLQVLEFRKKFEASDVALSVEMLNFLRDWLLKHIQGVDKRYGPYFNAKGMS